MYQDLSDIHGTITDLFADSPISGSQERADEYLAKFRRDGFLSGFGLLNERQIDILREELEVIMSPHNRNDPRFYEFHLNESTDPRKRLFHALGAWRIRPGFHDLVFYQPMIRLAEVLLGGSVRLWHDQVFVKPAHAGGIVAWHQDQSYWTRTTPVAHLTCWIGLDDSDEENGCVHYIPGSHKWPLLPRGQLSDKMNSIFEYLSEEQRSDFRPFASVQKAGEASFHHPLMIHGSFENRSKRPRRGIVINFIRDGVRSNTDEPLLKGVPVIGKGEPLSGRFFPMLSIR